MAGTPVKKQSKKGKTRWSIEVCVNGHRKKNSTFKTKNEALTWAINYEASLTKNGGLVAGMTFGEAMERYADEVSPSKGGAVWEIKRIKMFRRTELARIPLMNLTLEHGLRHRDERLKVVKPNTVIREFNLLKVILRKAVEWKWLDEYPWDAFRNPKAGLPRDRVIADSEIIALQKASGLDKEHGPINKTQEVVVMLKLAVATAMRKGEILAMRWQDIDLEMRSVHLPVTKTGVPRDVPLSSGNYS